MQNQTMREKSFEDVFRASIDGLGIFKDGVFFVFLRGDRDNKAAGKFVECWRARAAAGDPTTFATTFKIGLTSDYHDDVWR